MPPRCSLHSRKVPYPPPHEEAACGGLYPRHRRGLPLPRRLGISAHGTTTACTRSTQKGWSRCGPATNPLTRSRCHPWCSPATRVWPRMFLGGQCPPADPGGPARCCTSLTHEPCPPEELCHHEGYLPVEVGQRRHAAQLLRRAARPWGRGRGGVHSTSLAALEAGSGCAADAGRQTQGVFGPCCGR